jgi:hypothetical protein
MLLLMVLGSEVWLRNVEQDFYLVIFHSMTFQS